MVTLRPVKELSGVIVLVRVGVVEFRGVTNQGTGRHRSSNRLRIRYRDKCQPALASQKGHMTQHRTSRASSSSLVDHHHHHRYARFLDTRIRGRRDGCEGLPVAPLDRVGRGLGINRCVDPWESTGGICTSGYADGGMAVTAYP